MANLMTVPRFRAIDDDGNVMPGALLYFYVTGTTTPKAVYSDPDLDPGNALPQPVEADAGGLFPSIYYASGDYKVILKDADDVTVWTVDPVSGSTGADTLTTRGDLLTRDASGYKRLPIGTSGYVLGSNGVEPVWQAAVVPRRAIQGLTYANNGTDATNDIDISVGGAMDGTNARMMVLGSALTKRLDAAWAVGTNQGGLDTGSIADGDYFIWLINRSDTNVTDVLFSASATAPTMPADYNYKRLIGWFKRASSAIVAFKTYETDGGGIEFAWVTPPRDVNLTTTLGTTRRTDALSVPAAFSVRAHLRAMASTGAGGSAVVLCCPDEATAAPSVTNTPLATLYVASATQVIEQVSVRTSSDGKVASRASGTVDLYVIVTLGFEWSRR